MWIPTQSHENCLKNRNLSFHRMFWGHYVVPCCVEIKKNFNYDTTFCFWRSLYCSIKKKNCDLFLSQTKSTNFCFYTKVSNFEQVEEEVFSQAWEAAMIHFIKFYGRIWCQFRPPTRPSTSSLTQTKQNQELEKMHWRRNFGHLHSWIKKIKKFDLGWNVLIKI